MLLPLPLPRLLPKIMFSRYKFLIRLSHALAMAMTRRCGQADNQNGRNEQCAGHAFNVCILNANLQPKLLMVQQEYRLTAYWPTAILLTRAYGMWAGAASFNKLPSHCNVSTNGAMRYYR